MTNFENYLIEIGYIMYRQIWRKVNKVNTLFFEKVKDNKGYVSTMGDISFSYFPKEDPIHKLIEEEKELTWEDRKNVIEFGLHEKGFPPTLIYPRPKYKVWRDETNTSIDSDMNVILDNFPPERVLRAIKKPGVILVVDLRKSN